MKEGGERKNKQYKERREGERILLVATVNVIGMAEFRIDCLKD